MKVKELIEILKTFDSEKNIWIDYDCYQLQEPAFEVAEKEDIRGIEKGDYVHEVY